MIDNILDNITELYMIKYTFGEIFSSRGATLYKNPSDQTVGNGSRGLWSWSLWECQLNSLGIIPDVFGREFFPFGFLEICTQMKINKWEKSLLKMMPKAFVNKDLGNDSQVFPPTKDWWRSHAFRLDVDDWSL